MSGRQFRTIVADPPRPGGFWWANGPRRGGRSTSVSKKAKPAYELMSIDAIRALPVSEAAAEAAHLYLWVPDLHLIEGNAARVARAWGFEPGRLIVWAKKNPGLGRFPRAAHEAILTCSRGGLAFKTGGVPSVQHWKQVYDSRGKVHSAKPPEFLDLVEQESEGPYLELFARPPFRLGWERWGDEANSTIDLLEQAA